MTALCYRCQYAYAQHTNIDQQPICDNCKKNIDSKLEEEEVRLCPVDGSSMKKIVVETVVIDRCPKCDGVWFDKDEVQALTMSLKEEFQTTKKPFTEKDDKKSFFKGLLTGLIVD